MKKLFSLVAALVLAVGMFAADIAGPIAGTLTPKGQQLATGYSGSAINRGGFALMDDGVYFANNTTGKMGKMDLDLTTMGETDSIGKGYYMDVDDAGNIIIYEWTAGSSTLDIAQVYDKNYKFIRKDSLKINARCDMPRSVGNMVAGRGAYITVCNSVPSVLRFNYVDGVLTTTDTVAVPRANGGNSSADGLDVDHIVAQPRGSGLYWIDFTGAAPVVTDMTYFGANTFTSSYGGRVFKLAGHTLYVMGTYKVGGYLGSFAVYDITDPTNVSKIAEETSTMGKSAMGTACVTFDVKVDGDVATIYEYACFEVRKYELTVAPACFMKQGNEGSNWESMTAGENGTFTLEGIYAADSLWINGSAADEGATLYKRADITYNGTVLVKDTVKFTYDGVKKTMTIDSLGHFIPTLTFNVNIPEGTPSCFIYGNFTNKAFIRMKKLTDRDYTYTYRAEDALAENVKYLYAAGEGDAYLEDLAAERTYMEKDTVLKFKAVPVAQKIEYELNGGVTNDYGWTSKGAVALALMTDYNTAYKTTKAWAKQEDGIVYYHCGNTADNQPIWMTETAAAGQMSTVAGFIQNVTWNTTHNLTNLIANNKDKYGWLVDVFNANRAAQDLSTKYEHDNNEDESVYRKEIAGFFLASPSESNYPVSSNFTATAGADFYVPIWKHALSNPESVNAEFTLNAPYKEGFTFDGWYTTAEFSGDKVTKIDPKTASGKLYAKWIEYIPTIAEVKAMEKGTETKISGVVNWVRSGNVFIQDATGGFLLYTKDLKAEVGQKIVATGKRDEFNGKPQLSSVTITSTEDGELAIPFATDIATLLADTTGLKYFGQRVSVLGITIGKYDSYGNAWVTDGNDTVQCYYMMPDPTLFPVGSKVSLTAVASYNKGTFQFEGDVAGIVLVGGPAKDTYAYPARGENGEYTLTNNWIFSNVLENFEENKPGNALTVRGMAAKDGKMYFIKGFGTTVSDVKELDGQGSIIVVDAATGRMENTIKLGDHLFQTQKEDGAYTPAVTLGFNDIKFDGAGNCLMGACVAGGNTFFLYKVNLATGEATEILRERLYDNEDFKDNGYRFDAFGVYGDVNNNAIIMAADANSFNVYKWIITDGKAGMAEQIPCIIDPETDNSLLIDKATSALSVTSYGTAPQVFPISETLFYVDGFNTLPMLFDENGALADDFISVPSGVLLGNNEGDTCKLGQGSNGLCEFRVGDDDFLLMIGSHTDGVPNTAFALYKFADEAKEFSGLTPMWFFPNDGMGSKPNGCRTAVPTVEVNGNVATIYLYAQENGYAVYTFTGKESTAVDNIDAVKIEAKKVVENGQLYIIKNGVKYTVLGAVAK